MSKRAIAEARDLPTLFRGIAWRAFRIVGSDARNNVVTKEKWDANS